MEKFKFLIGGFSVSKDVSDGIICTEVIFNPWDARKCVIATVRKTDLDGKRELLAKFIQTEPSSRSIAGINAAIAMATSTGKSLNFELRSGDRAAPLVPVFMETGIVLCNPATNESLALISFSPIDISIPGAEVWGSVTMHRDKTVGLNNVNELVEFLGRHSIHVNFNGPSLSNELDDEGPRMAP